MNISLRDIFNQSKDYIMIVFGLFLCAFSFAAFIIPENVVTGGVTGIATIIFYLSDRTINIAIPNYAINVVLLVAAYRIVGKQFVIRTVFGATVFSIFLGILTPFFTHPFVEQQSFMNIIIGAVLCGVGLGITFSHGGSSGGTDVIAAMVNKYSNVSFGRMMLYCDLLIITSSYFLFHNVDSTLFGYVFLVINSVAADMAINKRVQGVQFLIFSEKWLDIANAINNDAKRGCTLIHGTGWYSKRDVKMLLVVCRKYESITVQRIIKRIDPNAFISMVPTNSVFGQGFDEMKVRLHKYEPKMRDENTDVQTK
ncbi:MAG: YitT family protein [Bacteroidales bacterium]|nr:YitT family protein [Bacteroidales bacterium]